MKFPLSKIFQVAGMAFVAGVSFAAAGSLSPSALPAATMHSLAEIWDTIASATYDSSAIVANQNGSLIGQLKYIEQNIVWASSSNDAYFLSSGNVGIGDATPETKFEVVGAASVSGNLNVYGTITSPYGAFGASEHFGATSTVTNSGGTAIGYGATANFFATAIGYSANAGSTGTSIGGGSFNTGFGFAGGNGAQATGTSVAIGGGATAHLDSIVIGSYARSSGPNQLVLGGSDPFSAGSIYDVFFGQGVSRSIAADVTLNPTGGAGTNVAGAALRIAGGRGTGSASGGALRFLTAPTGASGTSQNALVERMTILSNGNVGIGTVTPRTAFDVPVSIEATASYQVNIGGTSNTLFSSGNHDHIANGNGRKLLMAYDGAASTLRFIDISNPENIFVAGKASASSNIIGAAMDGRYAYVGDATTNIIQVFDITNPAVPALIATRSAPTGIQGMDLQGDYLYVVTLGDHIFRIFDVSNPANPILTYGVGIQHTPLGIDVEGRYAYITKQTYTHIFDISNPRAPTSLPTLNTGGFPIRILVRGNLMFIGQYSSNAVLVYDIRYPSAPVLLSTITGIPNPGTLTLDGATLYVGEGSGALNVRAYDVTNPKSPTLISADIVSEVPTNLVVVPDGAYLYTVVGDTLHRHQMHGARIDQLTTNSISTNDIYTKGALFANSGVIRGDFTVERRFSVVNNANITGTLQIQNNVGIASSSTSVRLAIVGSAGNFDVLSVASSSGASFLRVTKGGNVGIGDVSPEQKLTVVGNILASTSGNVDFTLKSTSNQDANFTLRTLSTGGGLQVLGSASQAFMTIASSGFVGIGATTPSTLLTVANTAADTDIFRLTDSDGDCTVNPETGATTFSCPSDARLKTDITDTASSALDYFSTFRIRDYTVISSGDRKTGVIAQELILTHPELVSSRSDGLLAVEQPNPYLLVRGIQELEALIRAHPLALESTGPSTPIAALLADLYDIIVDRGVLRVIKGIFDVVETTYGVTTYDEETGEPYCIKVKGGQLLGVSGACGEQPVSEPESEQVVEPEPQQESQESEATLDDSEAVGNELQDNSEEAALVETTGVSDGRESANPTQEPTE